MPCVAPGCRRGCDSSSPAERAGAILRRGGEGDMSRQPDRRGFLETFLATRRLAASSCTSTVTSCDHRASRHLIIHHGRGARRRRAARAAWPASRTRCASFGIGEHRVSHGFTGRNESSKGKSLAMKKYPPENYLSSKKDR